MPTSKWKVVICLLLGIVIFGGTLSIHAQNVTYNLISPLPGGTNQVSGENIFPQYARQLFAFALSAAAVLAFGMLVVGGIQYIASAGNESILKDAKDRIWNALIGLLLALAAWLILNTINPALVSNDIQIPAITTGIPGGHTMGFCVSSAGDSSCAITTCNLCKPDEQCVTATPTICGGTTLLCSACDQSSCGSPVFTCTQDICTGSGSRPQCDFTPNVSFLGFVRGFCNANHAMCKE